MKNYTGWICKKCKGVSMQNSCNGIRCSNCFSTNIIYYKKGKPLSKKEKLEASMVRIGLRTANPFGGSFDAMK